MKRMSVLILMSLVLSAGASWAAEDVVTRAMKAYEKRHYREAADMILAELATMDPAKRSAAQLTLGMAYLRSAELHRELARAGGTVSLDYLRKLSASGGRDRSTYVDLYYGESLIEAGRAADAAAPLERFIAVEKVMGGKLHRK